MSDFVLHERCPDGAEYTVGAKTIAECETRLAAWWTKHNETCAVARAVSLRDARDAENAARTAQREQSRLSRNSRNARDAPGRGGS